MTTSAKAICPRCRGRFPIDQRACPEDGIALFVIDVEDDPRVGAELDGRYTILGVLGSGGMGSVYRAVQHSMEREVAIKLLQADVARDPAVVSRFLVEARGVSHLAHPNTVSLFDFGQTAKGELYLVMEILRGPSLCSCITSTGMPVRRAAGIIAQLCAGLHHAHEAGIIHRDVKPANVILCESSQPPYELVKIIDFGVARVKAIHAAAYATKKGEIFGTPAYMSPEQALGDEIDRRSDLYAVGLLLFELLTGTHEHGGGGRNHGHEPRVHGLHRRAA